ncbi:hypothetical protein [Halomarina ordinaria]|uniref:Uncharacterized protein n=1 Tax=Halomarina ordinaria TaxID=3033939 RepID=A0ABD5U710_9EURY|nr:hypothetical protein [Halomarina sp. PSRA2]
MGLNIIPEPDSHDTPYYVPESAPVVNTNESDVEYICGKCETTLAELPYQVTLSAVLANLDELETIDAEIHVVQCPECSLFNEFPHKNNNPMNDSSSPPDFKENLERLLRQSERILSDEDYDPEGHFIDPDTHLLNNWDDIYNLSHKDLLQLPRYLSDAVFMTSPPRISYDHFLYWGWTAAFAVEHPISQEEPYQAVVREYLSLVHFMLFKLRHINSRVFYTRQGIATTIDGKEISWEEAWRVVDWGNPSLDHLGVLPDRYASTAGFAVLEGLLNNHCDAISSSDGDVTTDVASPWHPCQSTLKGDVTYHDKLQIWRHHSASLTVERTLSQIDDLTRYNRNTLIGNMSGVEKIVGKELESTNHFLRVVADQRNANLHGQLSTRVIGNLITTLSSLLIWDMIPEDGFEEHQEMVVEKVNNQDNEAFENVLSAPAFMPVDRVQHLLDIDTVTPADPRYPEGLRHFKYDDYQDE